MRWYSHSINTHTNNKYKSKQWTWERVSGWMHAECVRLCVCVCVCMCAYASPLRLLLQWSLRYKWVVWMSCLGPSSRRSFFLASCTVMNLCLYLWLREKVSLRLSVAFVCGYKQILGSSSMLCQFSWAAILLDFPCSQCIQSHGYYKLKTALYNGPWSTEVS